jgi:hypothetical protein
MYLLTRTADAAERLLWERQDASLRAVGFDVVRLGRWGRQYRHPAKVADTLARAARAECAMSGEAALTCSPGRAA